MDWLTLIIGALAMAALSAGWIGVQFLARKMKTKNHFDDLNGPGCSSCTCGGEEGTCVNKAAE